MFVLVGCVSGLLGCSFWFCRPRWPYWPNWPNRSTDQDDTVPYELVDDIMI